MRAFVGIGLGLRESGRPLALPGDQELREFELDRIIYVHDWSLYDERKCAIREDRSSLDQNVASYSVANAIPVIQTGT